MRNTQERWRSAADPGFMECLSRDEEGRLIFSPWHDLGRGYFLPDGPRLRQVVRFLKGYGVVLWLVLLGGVAVWGMGSPYYILLLVATMLGYDLGCRALARGLAVARERPPFRETCATAAWRMGLPTLLFGFSVFLFCAWGCAWLLFRGNLGIGLPGVVVSGIAANFIGYLISLRVRADRDARTP